MRELFHRTQVRLPATPEDETFRKLSPRSLAVQLQCEPDVGLVSEGDPAQPMRRDARNPPRPVDPQCPNGT